MLVYGHEYLCTTVARDYVVDHGVIQLHSHAQTVCYSSLAQPRPLVEINPFSSRCRRDQDVAAVMKASRKSRSEASLFCPDWPLGGSIVFELVYLWCPSPVAHLRSITSPAT
jgi:hypothetical protein